MTKTAFCRLCSHEVYLVGDKSILNGVVVGSSETWRNAVWSNDVLIPGTAECKGSADGLHDPLPSLDDPEQLAKWLDAD